MWGFFWVSRALHPSPCHPKGHLCNSKGQPIDQVRSSSGPAPLESNIARGTYGPWFWAPLTLVGSVLQAPILYMVYNMIG